VEVLLSLVFTVFISVVVDAFIIQVEVEQMAVVCVPLLVSAAKFHCHHNLQHILKNLQAEKAADIIPRMQRIGYHMINCTKEVAGFIPLTDL